jgi:hypothetical protein
MVQGIVQDSYRFFISFYKSHRHRENGAVIVRCSQPEVGWFFSRCLDDEFYLQNLGNVVAKPAVNGEKETVNVDSDSSDDACDGDTPHTNGFSGI